MNDWDYMLTMRRLKQLAASPSSPIEVPIHYSGNCADCGTNGILNHDKVCPACHEERMKDLGRWYDEKEGK